MCVHGNDVYFVGDFQFIDPENFMPREGKKRQRVGLRGLRRSERFQLIE